MTLRCFDFDGCLFDTAYECAVVAWCVRDGIERDFASVTMDAEFLHRFYAVKPYIRYAREYVVFSSDAYESITDQAALTRVVTARLSAAELDAYQDRFYQTREAIKKESFSGWLALNRPYPFAVDALRSVADTAVILSSKDRKTIVETLSASGITPRAVCDFTYAPTKLEALRKLSQKLGVALQEAVVLDDNVDHLLELQGSGVRPLLASWGYVSPEQRERARAARIALATPANLRTLMGIDGA